jgi:hypothetical protein
LSAWEANITGVPADQAGDDVLLQIRRHGQLTAVQGRVADTVDTVFGDDLQRHEVPSGAGHDDLGVDDLRHPALTIGGHGAERRLCCSERPGQNWSDQF